MWEKLKEIRKETLDLNELQNQKPLVTDKQLGINATSKVITRIDVAIH